MYSIELCIARKCYSVADGVVAGLMDRSADVELYIVFRCSEVASFPRGKSMHLPLSGVAFHIIARWIGRKHTFTA